MQSTDMTSVSMVTASTSQRGPTVQSLAN